MRDDLLHHPTDPENRLPTDGEDGDRDSKEPKTKIDDLVQLIKETADKLGDDNTSRGDVKILSRAIRELRHAFRVFAPHRKRRKVTIFGSARTPPDDPAYIQALEYGRAMAERNWMVVTGAASGIMEAGHRGAGREHSMGINIMLPFEQSANPVIAGDEKLVHMKYFFTRKLMFVKECDALVCLPGGFGTLDEALEVLTLLQTGKRDMAPVVFLDAPGGGYWKGFHEFVKAQLLQNRMISPEDLSLYLVTDRLEEAVEEVTGFYSVYHSMRYVKNKLVIRLRSPIHPSLLEDINEEFPDILSGGVFEAREALKAEHDEPDLLHMPRLAFQFNRRNLGRLRQLINCLNKGCLTLAAK